MAACGSGETLLHAHDADAGFDIPGEDGRLYRRRSAPARQQRGMYVDASNPRDLQYLLGEQQTVGHYNQQIGLQRSQRCLGFRVPERGGLQNIQSPSTGKLLDGARPLHAAAPRRTIGLRQHTDDRVPGIHKALQRCDREVGRSGENDAAPPVQRHGWLSAARQISGAGSRSRLDSLSRR
jgi:hypothetical protein